MPKRDYYIFICTNERAENSPRGSCARGGAREIVNHLKVLLHERGLKERIRVLQSSCLECCASGPAMVVYPQDVWYRNVTRELVEQVLDRLAEDGVLPDEQRLPLEGFE